MRAICIDNRGVLGGTCTNIGCVPSKALLNSAKKYVYAKRKFERIGIKVEGLEFDLQKIMKQKDATVTALTRGIEILFHGNKIDYARGSGRLLSPEEIEVRLSSGQVERVKAKNIVIATGSDRAPFPGISLDGTHVVSSTGALSLPRVPARMVVVGAGVTGVELSDVYHGLGARITVIESAERILGEADHEVAEYMTRLLTLEGYDFLLQHTAVSGGKGEVVAEDNRTHKRVTVRGDVIMLTNGRIPYTHGLGAREIGVKFDDGGRIQVNERLQVSPCP